MSGMVPITLMGCVIVAMIMSGMALMTSMGCVIVAMIMSGMVPMTSVGCMIVIMSGMIPITSVGCVIVTMIMSGMALMTSMGCVIVAMIMSGMVPITPVVCVTVIMVMGRMMVGLGTRTMVMSTVAIAGQEANQDQGQAPASKGDGRDITVAFETTPKGGHHGGGDQNGHGNMKTSSQRRLKSCERWHAGQQKRQGHTVHQTQSARRDSKAIPQAVTMAELFSLHGGASYN